MPWSDDYQSDEDFFLEYRYAPGTDDDWEEDEVWLFHRTKTQEISLRQSAIIEKYGDGPGKWNTSLLMAMTKSFNRRLPKNFRAPKLDKKGEPIFKDGQPVTIPHPYAGKAPPLTPEVLGKLSELELMGALQMLVPHITPRDKHAQEEFRERPHLVSRSGETDGSEGESAEVPSDSEVPATDHPDGLDEAAV